MWAPPVPRTAFMPEGHRGGPPLTDPRQYLSNDQQSADDRIPQSDRGTVVVVDGVLLQRSRPKPVSTASTESRSVFFVVRP